MGADTLVAGRYRLVHPLGSGGMGTVWRAEDQVLGRAVALKLLHREFAADEPSRRRFRSEAQAAASINHPNVVGVFDYGEQPEDGEYLSFLVMELVEGRSVRDELAARGTLSNSEVKSIVEQTALGLSAAHSLGLVHRDVKPANLLLGADGLLKVTDFGIARATDATPLTRTGTMVGTAQYLSPEQAQGLAATPASDLYSLGVVAFACLAGTPPFSRETAVATMLAHVRDPIPSLPPGTPRALRSLVTDLLAKDPGERPASGLEVARRSRGGSSGGPKRVRSTGAGEGSRTQVLPATDVLPAAAGPGRDDHENLLAHRSGASGLAPAQRLLVGARAHKRSAVLGAALAVALAIGLVALPSRSSTVKVPNVVGESLASARTTLARVGLGVAVQTVDSPNHPAGDVLREDPRGGTVLGRGKLVQLAVASGMVEVDPASYIGLPYPTAASELASLGLHPVLSSTASADNVGSVDSVSPSGRVAVGSTVMVGVAQPVAPPRPGHGDNGGGPGKRQDN